MANFFQTVPLVRRQGPTWPTSSPSADGSLQKFQDVPTEGGIDTERFLLASEGLVKVFGSVERSN